MASWLTNGCALPLATNHIIYPSAAPLTVTEMIAKYWPYATEYDRKPDGSPTSEIDALRHVLRPLNERFSPCSTANSRR